MVAGEFRSDLYFRLSVHQMELPPLRERMEDLPRLINRFIEDAALSMEKTPVPSPPAELYDLLGIYSFPGNIRELRALVYDAVAAHRSGPFLSMERFRTAVDKQQAGQQADSQLNRSEKNNYHAEELLTIAGQFPTLSQAETALVHEAMKRANGNQGVAATLLGISRPALNRRLARLHGKE